MLETIENNKETLAYILRRTFDRPGIHFFTPGDYSQQLGFMKHPAGKRISPHQHNICERSITMTQEVLFIRKGRVRVDFYDKQCAYLESRVLEAGDVILLASGGHGFEALEELEMVEVKQGPYMGEQDKTRFEAPTPEKLNWGEQ